MRINNIKPPIYENRYKPKSDINFKNSGTGLIIGWGLGTISSLVITSKKAIQEDLVLPTFLDSLIVFFSGVLGGILGHNIENFIKRKW